MIYSFFAAVLLLTQSALGAGCEAKLQSPGVNMFDCGGIKVVRLSGPPVDRARAMGNLLRGPLSRQSIDYFSNKVTDVLHREAGIFSWPLRLAFNQIVRSFHRQTPPALAAEVDALALGIGMDPIDLRRGLTLPDAGAAIYGLGSFPLLHAIPSAGCTSIAARRADGGLVYGRNLDFAGVGIFDRHPMLLAVDPPEGSGELRHLVIGTDGLLFGGITGVNEAGLMFAVHQNFSRDIGTSGVPMMLIGELVLRDAHNLEEARAILEKNRPAVQWTFVVTDLRNGKVMAVESSSRVFLSREMEGSSFVQTNHAMHSESRAFETSNLGTLDNSIFRMKQAYAMMDTEKKPNASLAARILSYQEDPKGQLSAYHDILKGETIQTVIVDAPMGSPATLYLGAEETPASSGKYAAFSLDDFWKKDFIPSMETVDLALTPPPKRAQQRNVAEAFRLYFDAHNFSGAAQLLENQHTLDAALFRATVHYQMDRFDDALAIADSALHDQRFVGEPAFIRLSLEEVRLCALLRLGRFGEARNLAEKILAQKPLNQKLKSLCEIVSRGDRPDRWMLKLAFSFFSGDLSGRKY